MTDLFEQNVLFVKEHVALFRLATAYDILDPATGTLTATVRERVDSPLIKVLKFTSLRRHLPFTIEVLDPIGQRLLGLKRPFAWWRSRVTVYDNYWQPLGWFQQRLGLGGRFEVYDATGHLTAHIQGDWKSWNFQFVDQRGQPLATITKKWAGLSKELLTSADNYVVEIPPTLTDPTQRKVVVGAVICIDMVLKGK